MPPLARRILLVLLIGLRLFLAGYAIVVAKRLAAWHEPRRSLKAGSSIFAGLLYACLLVRDLRGKPVPASGLALPVFLVVGGNWLSDAFRLDLQVFLIFGAAGVLLGAWGLFSLLIRLTRVETK